MKISKSTRKMSTKARRLSTGSGETPDDAIARGGVATPFPWKLHEMLEDASREGNDGIVSWQTHGRSFIVHKPKVFVEKIMPTYFNQSKFASFQRQLNLYGFNRLTAGSDKGAYYHDFFIRGQKALCRGMVRQKIKGTKVRRTLAPEEEPNFYSMANVAATSVEARIAPTATTPSGSSSSSGPPPPLEMEAARIRQESIASSRGRSRDRSTERLDTVRNVLKQTEGLVGNSSENMDMDFENHSSSHTSVISDVPSVSPVDSEESDSDESSFAMSPNHHHHHYQKQPPIAMLQAAPLVPLLSSRTTTTTMMADSSFMKGGDILFFEGKPFHYLEHLDTVPETPSDAVVIKQVPKNIPTSFYQRGDTLQSLMRVDPKAIIMRSTF